MKKFSTGFFLTVVSIIFALLFCELAIRLTGVGSMTISFGSLYLNDPDAGWVGAPNINERFLLPGDFDVRIVHNSKGLRDSEKNYAKPSGIRRILVLGDSYAWGFGVENEEMVSTVIQDLLSDVETVNFGVKGYSTVQELIRLETEGLRYDPDLTLLFFCWNDLEDNFDDKELRRPAAVFVDDDILKITNRPVQRRWKSPVKQWFQANVRLYSFARYGSEHLKFMRKEWHRSRAHQAKVRPVQKSHAKKTKNGKLEISRPDLYIAFCPEMDRAWKAVHLLLARAMDSAVKGGGHFAVVYVANKEAVDRDVFAEVMNRAGFDPEAGGLDWDRPSRKLAEICRELKIPYIDLNPVFRTHPEPMSLFFKKDPHWSASGHRLAAETIAASIEGFRQ